MRDSEIPPLGQNSRSRTWQSLILDRESFPLCGISHYPALVIMNDSIYLTILPPVNLAPCIFQIHM